MSAYWHPLGANSSYSPPKPGDLIAWSHGVWAVQSVESVPDDQWTDHDRLHEKTTTPVVVIVRPTRITSTDVRARDHDKHVRHRHGARWNIYPDAHYPVCGACLEPLPCRDQVAEREARRSMAHMERYVQPSVCPSCQELITTRQKVITFEENLELPGGPPVTFHVGRSNCREVASRYEKRWAERKPEERSTTLSCPGTVTNHNDGTYECTEYVMCRGPLAFHPMYVSCDDRECRANGAFGCHPWPDAKLRQVTP